MGWSVKSYFSDIQDRCYFLDLKWKIYQYGNYAKSYLKTNQKRQNQTGASSREPNQGRWQFFFASVLRDNIYFSSFITFYNLQYYYNLNSQETYISCVWLKLKQCTLSQSQSCGELGWLGRVCSAAQAEAGAVQGQSLLCISPSALSKNAPLWKQHL